MSENKKTPAESAAQKIAEQANCFGLYSLTRSEVSEALDALKKQVPIEPTKDARRRPQCPICLGVLRSDSEYARYGETEYCNHCGQAINWSSNATPALIQVLSEETDNPVEEIREEVDAPRNNDREYVCEESTQSSKKEIPAYLRSFLLGFFGGLIALLIQMILKLFQA